MHAFLLTLVLLVQVLAPRGVQVLFGSTAPGSEIAAASPLQTSASPMDRAPSDDRPTLAGTEAAEEDDDSDSDDPVLVRVYAITPSTGVCISLGWTQRPAEIPGEVTRETLQARGPPTA